MLIKDKVCYKFPDCMVKSEHKFLQIAFKQTMLWAVQIGQIMALCIFDMHDISIYLSIHPSIHPSITLPAIASATEETPLHNKGTI